MPLQTQNKIVKENKFLMMEVNICEQTLIHEMMNGSQKAFDSIYKMYAKRLYAFCLQYTKIPEDAEEIVEDVFVKLWTNKDTIRQEETLRSLLFTMAKNKLINAYRSRLNSPSYENYVAYSSEMSEDSASDHLEYEEFLQQLNNALKKLPKTQQNVIKLSKFQQLSNKEIAERLSLSEQTVKNQMSLGLKLLREELKNASIAIYLLFLINYQ